MKHSLFIVALVFVVVVIGYAMDDLGYWPACEAVMSDFFDFLGLLATIAVAIVLIYGR